MFNYAIDADFGIQFDLKKFYYELDIHEDFQQYFGFIYPMSDGEKATYFVWTVLPYGYTRAPFLAKSIMKPLISKWHQLQIFTCVFVDDGMAVSKDEHFLKQASLQIQCDLLRLGLLPGIEKCFWQPRKLLNWNGIKWDFSKKQISILDRRIHNAKENLFEFIGNWPKVSFRHLSQFVGRINSMHPVFQQRGQLRTRMLQTLINVRHYYDCSWDKEIFSIYGPKLFRMAKDELLFWAASIDQLNARQFQTPPPEVVGWVDASSFAHGGLMCSIRPEFVGIHRPLTADNLLGKDIFSGLASFKDGAK